MSPGAELLNRLAGWGVELTRDGDRLVVDGPAELLTESVMAEIRAHKAYLLEVTSGPPSEPRSEPSCPRCRSTEYRDIVLQHAPHNGTSTRRDCHTCGKFIQFVRWYETDYSEN